MKNNKGFTLIELLAVVVILITIIVIITPKVFKQLKTAENVTDKEQINAIINATQLYMNQNTNLLPEQNEMNIISLNELKESGLIKSSQILNPSTKKELTGCIVVKYEKNKYKYEYKEENDCNNVITVTFDPQGGRLDQTTKQVIPNDTYGNLPTPTREGYTFMGWNGKNMFTGLVKGVAINSNNGEAGPNALNAASDYMIINTDLSNYFLSGLSSDLWSYVSFYNENKEYMGRTAGTSRKNITIQSTSIMDSTRTNVGGNIKYIRITQYANSVYSTGTIDDIDDLQIQLEIGDTATPYEPYYITPTTKVVQENNHTLKAIWQAN